MFLLFTDSGCTEKEECAHLHRDRRQDDAEEGNKHPGTSPGIGEMSTLIIVTFTYVRRMTYWLNYPVMLGVKRQ